MRELINRLPGQALRIGVSGAGVSLLRSSRWPASWFRLRRGGADSAVAGPAFLSVPGLAFSAGFAPGIDLLAEQSCPALDDGAPHPGRAIGPALRELLAGRDLRGWPVSFVLAGDLARLWLTAPPPRATRRGDLEAAAALRFHALYGDSAAAWRIAGDWDSRAPFLSAAVPRPLLATLADAAAGHGMVVAEVLPHFVAAWNRRRGALTAGAWFGVAHGGVLTLAIVAGKRLHAVRTLPLPPGAGPAWLTQTLEREALLAGQAMPALLQLCGQVPSALADAAGGDGADDASASGTPLPGRTAAGLAAAAAGASGRVPCVVLDTAFPGRENWSAVGLLAREGLAA